MEMASPAFTPPAALYDRRRYLDHDVVALGFGSAALPVVIGRRPSSRAIPVNSCGEVRQWERF